MKVCVISHTYIESGYLPALNSLASIGGVKVSLITPASIRLSKTSLKGTFSGKGTTLPFIPLRVHLDGRQGTYIFAPRGLAKALEEFSPDVIYLEQESFSFCAGQIARVAERMNIPLVIFVWENLDRKLSFPRRQLRTYVLARCAGLVAGSVRSAEVHRRWGFPGKLVILPQMGVPEVASDPLLGFRCPTELRLVFAGRLVSYKGVDCLVRAIKVLRDRSIPAVGVILGNGQEKERLTSLVDNLELDSVVDFRGSVSMSEVSKVLRSTDVLVLPSRTTKTWEEQFGRVLIQAMAQGTVVVGSRTGAIPEVIGNREDLLFNEDDHKGLANILENLYVSPDLFAQHQRALWERVQTEYLNDVLSQRRAAFLAEVSQYYSPTNAL